MSPIVPRSIVVLIHLDKRVRDLSGGLKQRLALALALLAPSVISAGRSPAGVRRLNHRGQ